MYYTKDTSLASLRCQKLECWGQATEDPRRPKVRELGVGSPNRCLPVDPN